MCYCQSTGAQVVQRMTRRGTNKGLSCVPPTDTQCCAVVDDNNTTQWLLLKAAVA
jgi:hypothetical protein